VEILIDDGSKTPLILDVLGRGSCIGFYAVLQRESYSYSGRALDTSEGGLTIFSIDYQDLLRMR
jgi:hypothetical protein